MNLRDVVPWAWGQEEMHMRAYAEDMITDKEVAKIAVGHNPWLFRVCSGDLRDDAEIVLLAVSRVGELMKYAGVDCRDDFDLVWAAIEHRGSMQHASQRLQGNRQLAMFAVRMDPDCLRFLQPWLLRDAAVLNNGLWRNPRQFMYLPRSLRKDPEVKDYVRELTQHTRLSSLVSAFSLDSDSE